MQLRLSLAAHTQKHLSTDPMEEELQTWLVFSGIKELVQCCSFSSSSDFIQFTLFRVAIFRKRNNSRQAGNLTMGHFDNIWCRYKRYYFGKTLKCEIKSYSLGRPKCFGRFSTAKVEVGTPGSFFKFNLNQLNQFASIWLRSNSKVLWRRVGGEERHILACMHVLKASQRISANFLAKPIIKFF